MRANSTLITALLFTLTAAVGCGGHSSSKKSASTAAAVSSGQSASASGSTAPGSNQPLASAQAPGSGNVGATPTTPGGSPALPSFPSAPNTGTPNTATPNTGTPNAGTPNTGTPNTGTQPAGPQPAQPMPDPDSDNDGLTDSQEALLGTDPQVADTDQDGVIDGRDLAPLYGAKDYGAFGTEYPAGTIRSQRTFRAAGLSGRSEVQSWNPLKSGWRPVYQGRSGTRSSDVNSKTVAAALEARFAQSDFAPTAARPTGDTSALGEHKYAKQVLSKRYHVDYAFDGSEYDVDFRNRAPIEQKDPTGETLATSTVGLTVQGGMHSTLTLQFAVAPGADRFFFTANAYAVPIVSYQVFDGPDPMQANLVLDEVTVGAPLHRYAYEARMPLVTPQGKGAKRWTVVITPFWGLRTGNAPIELRALANDEFNVAAAAHDLQLQTGNNQVTRLKGVFSTFQGLTTDLARAAVTASYDEVKTNERLVISGDESTQEWIVSALSVTARFTRAATVTLVYVDERSNAVRGTHLTDLMDPQSARRYHAVTRHLMTVGHGASAVFSGYNAVVAWREGDQLRTASYTASTAASVYLLADSVGLVRANYGAVAGLSAAAYGLDAYAAYKDGDEAMAVVNMARGAGSVAALFVAGKQVKGLPGLSLVTVAVGVVDVGFHVYKSQKQSDGILRQAHLEMATAAAVDVGITVIPTVGPVIQIAWRGAWTAITFVQPELAKQRMYSSPGTYVTYVGQVFLTKSIPSALAEIAYEQAADALIVVVGQLEDKGIAAVVILPQVGAAQETPETFTSAPTRSGSESGKAYHESVYAKGDALKAKVGGAIKAGAGKVGGAIKSAAGKVSGGIKTVAGKVTAPFAKSKTVSKVGGAVKSGAAKTGSSLRAAGAKISSSRPASFAKTVGGKVSGAFGKASTSTRSAATSAVSGTKSFFGKIGSGIKSGAAKVKAAARTNDPQAHSQPAPSAPSKKPSKKGFFSKLF